MAAPEIPEIQVLEKERYFTQALVRLPDAVPLPALAPSSLRIRTEELSLTSNNFTYAQLGSILGWWDVHPLPDSTPAPYNDTAKYGCINCWGYARVLESTFAGVEPGSYVYGYLPIGTLPLDLEVTQGALEGHIVVTSSYRQKQMPSYNRYRVLPASKGEEIRRKDDSVAYYSLIGVMHWTSYLLNQYVFSSDPKETFTPSPGSAATSWTPEMADLTDAIVINFAPGSKVGLAFAYLLRNERDGAKPGLVVGVSSAASRPFVEGTGLYDAVAQTDEDPVATVERVRREGKANPDAKIVVCDFGGRAGSALRWVQALRQGREKKDLVYLGIGSEIAEGFGAEAAEHMKADAAAGLVQVNADDMLTRAIEKVGPRAFYEGLDASWEGLRSAGIKGFKVRWGEGMEDVIKGWDSLARGEVGSDEGLAFKI